MVNTLYEHRISLVKWALVLLVGVSLYFSPTPKGLKPEVWQLFAFYLAAIVGIIIKPAPESVVLLAIGGFGSIIMKPAFFLSGFSSPVVWIVFTAFMISLAFSETGIGKRIAYIMIGKFGNTSLRIGYIMAIVDFVLSPATPSNTARSCGITYPIFQNVAITLDSRPGPTSDRIGGYLTILQHVVCMTTSGLFLTACAPNTILAGLSADIMGYKITWISWMMAMIVPGGILLATGPYIVYRLYTPQIKNIASAKEISAEGLRAMGPMTAPEKRLVVLFILAIAGWALGDFLGIDATGVALAFLASSLLLKVVSWEKILGNTSGWNTLIWYGFIVGIAGRLAGGGFFKWLTGVAQAHINFQGLSEVTILLLLLVSSLLARYLFASMAAYASSFIPMAMVVGHAAGVSAMPLMYLMVASTTLGALLTHYGGAPGPMLIGTKYVSQLNFWKIGAILVVYGGGLYMTVGMTYWKLFGMW